MKRIHAALLAAVLILAPAALVCFAASPDLTHRNTPPVAAAPKPTLKTWVHIFGCPSSTRSKMGPQHVVLIFSDGTSVVLRVDTATDENRKKLAEFIGDLDGTNIKYDCGSQA
jgi:hypothetical protein